MRPGSFTLCATGGVMARPSAEAASASQQRSDGRDRRARQRLPGEARLVEVPPQIMRWAQPGPVPGLACHCSGRIVAVVYRLQCQADDIGWGWWRAGAH